MKKKNGRMRRWLLALALPVWVLVLPTVAEACVTCFGQSDSDLARGMNMGIFTLLGVLAFVLSSLVAFFVFIGVRSAQGESALEDQADEE
jgi:hypothetical protein